MLQNKIIGVIGPKGSGKSYRSAKLFAQCHCAILYDIAHDEDYYQHATLITNDTAQLFKELRKWKDSDDSAIETGGERVPFRAIYQVQNSDLMPKGKELIYLTATPVVEECYFVGNCTLFLDEAHELCSQYSIDWRLRKVVRLARHQQLNIVWISQSMNEIHREIRRNTDEYHFYKIHEPRDLEAIGERCGEECAVKVSQLQRLKRENGKLIPGTCLVWVSDEQ